MNIEFVFYPSVELKNFKNNNTALTNMNISFCKQHQENEISNRQTGLTCLVLFSKTFPRGRNTWSE